VPACVMMLAASTRAQTGATQQEWERTLENELGFGTLIDSAHDCMAIAIFVFNDVQCDTAFLSRAKWIRRDSVLKSATTALAQKLVLRGGLPKNIEHAQAYLQGVHNAIIKAVLTSLGVTILLHQSLCSQRELGNGP
jgi:hypothetical protein